MRTPEEIVAKIAEHAGGISDFFSFIRGDLIEVLPFEHAKPFLKAGVTADQWKPDPHDREALLARMFDYMPFAWEKANGCRGISAGRSLNHMEAWLWLAGEDDFLAAIKLDDYTHYGKPELRAICEKFEWDWRAWDDGEWRNNEDGPFQSPNDVPTLHVP